MIDVVIELVVHAPLDRTFAAFTDHEAFSDVPGISCRLIAEGAPTRAGLGAVRSIGGGGVYARERVLEFDPPRAYAYVVEGGVPLRHEGARVQFSERGSDATSVVWTTRVGLPSAILGRFLDPLVVRPVVTASLRALAASARRRAEQAPDPAATLGARGRHPAVGPRRHG